MMNYTRQRTRITRYFVTALTIVIVGTITTPTPAAEEPETVMVTFHVKAGKGEDLNRLLTRAWATYQRLGMVLPQPHIVARSIEGDTTFFELFSWKDHGVPDSAPSEVRDLWNQMEAICEQREGQSGINFVEVKVIEGAKP
jgi:hypothetical protein